MCRKHYLRAHRPRKPRKLKPAVPCSFNECDRVAKAHGLCNGHRSQRYYGRPLTPLRGYAHGRTCDFDGCNLRHLAGGLCKAHYEQRRRGESLRTIRSGDQGHIDAHGYRTIRVGGRPVKEHRFVMEQVLGRELLPGENVHHLNGVRHDNRPENLELWVTMQPSGQRPADLLAWAYEIIRRYGSNDSCDDIAA